MLRSRQPSGATFTRVFFDDAGMRDVDLTGAQTHGALFHESRMRGVELPSRVMTFPEGVLHRGVDGV